MSSDGPTALASWSLGTIKRVEIAKGQWRARTRYRDFTGDVRQVEARGKSGAAERPPPDHRTDRAPLVPPSRRPARVSGIHSHRQRHGLQRTGDRATQARDHPEELPPQPPHHVRQGRTVPTDPQEVATRPTRPTGQHRRTPALLDTFTEVYNQRRPHRSLPKRSTPATAYAARPKATPRPDRTSNFPPPDPHRQDRRLRHRHPALQRAPAPHRDRPNPRPNPRHPHRPRPAHPRRQHRQRRTPLRPHPRPPQPRLPPTGRPPGPTPK